MSSTDVFPQQTDSERLAAISERIAALRVQTAGLVERASEVASHTQELRVAARPTCRHAAQVHEMQTALEAVEHELDSLRTAMMTRGVIEQAKGMLMLHRHVDADTAFRVLVELSQTSHRKLVDVARALVATWSVGDHANT